MTIIRQNPTTIHTREVWAHNLQYEFQLIREIAIDYPYMAMDTEFPGFVVPPNYKTVDMTDRTYETMKNNVNSLELIQVGLTFSDENGNLARCGTTDDCVWQFNFKFDLETDLYADASIEMLQRCGIDFQAHAKRGIEPARFSELLILSRIVQNACKTWVTFHGIYDFGYLLKSLTGQNLPDSQDDFFSLLRIYFPVVYDTKYMMESNNLRGGLEKLAETLEVKRIGQSHQAGSDSLLTLYTFRKLSEKFLNGCPEWYAGVLYGLEERYLYGFDGNFYE